MEWISTKDRLPQTGEPCWIVYAGCVQAIAYSRQGRGFNCSRGYVWETYFDIESDYIPDEVVSHWMPMPDPPEVTA